MKFLIDADCPYSLGEKLKKAGHEVLVTRDTDFGNTLLYPLGGRCAVILMRTLLLSSDQLFILIQDVLKKIPAQDILGNLIVVRPGRYRIYRF